MTRDGDRAASSMIISRICEFSLIVLSSVTTWAFGAARGI
jgi:hypothetical protein